MSCGTGQVQRVQPIELASTDDDGDTDTHSGGTQYVSAHRGAPGIAGGGASSAVAGKPGGTGPGSAGRTSVPGGGGAFTSSGPNISALRSCGDGFGGGGAPFGRTHTRSSRGA
ncbi:Uncharacterised protein [Mycobacteroides abscessus subsp. abscessus]|nr:Uncharacterised protein [Mycobacteroides abscessus subsp. abscessus]SKW75463.1 Uncharacterised protein [Mycobacteroides abscessus subsp. abscessus]